MGFLFEKLEVYQKAIDFTDRVMHIVGGLPRGQRVLADQLKRASLSISLNIAEGNGRWHAKERKNFFFIARGSAFECVPLLEICKRKGWVHEELHRSMKGEIEVMAKMLSALIKQADARR